MPQHVFPFNQVISEGTLYLSVASAWVVQGAPSRMFHGFKGTNSILTTTSTMRLLLSRGCHNHKYLDYKSIITSKIICTIANTEVGLWFLILGQDMVIWNNWRYSSSSLHLNVSLVLIYTPPVKTKCSHITVEIKLHHGVTITVQCYPFQ